jgi:acetyl esterase/lipase
MIRPIVALLMSSIIAHAEWTNLWPDEAPGAPRPAAGSEKIADGWRYTDIEVPQYFVYLPEKDKATGAAAVILPGGGYGILAMNHEGHDYAKWLVERGIAGIVVKYRVSGNPALGYQYPVPLMDARRAIRTARAKAADWNLDAGKIGIMGSSAGGHLASMCATLFNESIEQETRDEIDKLSARPDFAVLIYPVISTELHAHTGSRRNLLGADAAPELVARTSTERAVSPETPPVFLLSTSDDSVDCRNSLMFASACKEHGVPVSLHLFESGGHGYGLTGKGDLAAWPDLLERWLATRLAQP